MASEIESSNLVNRTGNLKWDQTDQTAVEKIKIFLINILPRVYRTINNTIYFLINLVKSAVRIAVNQLKNE